MEEKIILEKTWVEIYMMKHRLRKYNRVFRKYIFPRTRVRNRTWPTVKYAQKTQFQQTNLQQFLQNFQQEKHTNEAILERTYSEIQYFFFRKHSKLPFLNDSLCL